MTRILFATPFKPFGIDDRYSRRDSFPEIFHNRLTREQGIFSYRSFYNALGLHAIANNISASSNVLEYPTFRRFLRELKKDYDYVGLGSMMANFQKVRVMAEAVREHSPRSRIVIGGPVACLENVDATMPVDHLCTGEGIGFMRDLLGDPPDYEFKNPNVHSRGHSIMGVPLFNRKNPQIIIGLGCPNGCDYCGPSYQFGRRHIRFFRTGEEIFREMERMERIYKSRAFGFNGDDNFLVDGKRAEQIRELVVKSGKQYEIVLFASSDTIRKFGVDRLAEMGVSMVWVGRESCFNKQRKNEGVNFREFIKELREHGIKTIVSSMLLMEHHTRENIWEDVEDHIAARPDFSMFSFCGVVPGTPYYDRQKEAGRILWGHPYEEWNGVERPHSLHPCFNPLEGKRLREKAVEREYLALGPSPMRVIETDLEGYLFMRESDNPLLRKRADYLAENMSNYRAVLWAMARLVPTTEMREMVMEVLGRVERVFGPMTAWEKTEGLGVWAFGTKQKVRYRVLGDNIQPPTTITGYPGRK